jgi:peptidyl-prolyl cis-trans isomerase C
MNPSESVIKSLTALFFSYRETLNKIKEFVAMKMKNTNIMRIILAIMMIALLFVMPACSKKDEKSKEVKTPASSAPALEAVQAQPLASPDTANLVVDVNGARLTKSKLDADVESKMQAMKGQIPADQLKKARPMIRQRLINDFVIRILLAGEVKKQGLTASEKEINDAIELMKRKLPSGTSIEDLMKKNQVTPAAFRDEIRFGIKINKLVMAAMGSKSKPTSKDIEAYYKSNKDKFKMPETVKVRHILIAKNNSDSEKIKSEKKAKAESIREQILGGADFAELAKKNSDCPSKDKGGELGVFPKGQMVKLFEDAAFSQKKNEIGPVVETEFGYHIIQVMDKYPPKTMPLDDNMKKMISNFLVHQRQQETFEALVKNLKDKATITLYEKPSVPVAAAKQPAAPAKQQKAP